MKNNHENIKENSSVEKSAEETFKCLICQDEVVLKNKCVISGCGHIF